MCKSKKQILYLRYGFDPKNVGAKMNNVKQLEKREKQLVRTGKELAKQTAK